MNKKDAIEIIRNAKALGFKRTVSTLRCLGKPYVVQVSLFQQRSRGMLHISVHLIVSFRLADKRLVKRSSVAVRSQLDYQKTLQSGEQNARFALDYANRYSNLPLVN